MATNWNIVGGDCKLVDTPATLEQSSRRLMLPSQALRSSPYAAAAVNKSAGDCLLAGVNKEALATLPLLKATATTGDCSASLTSRSTESEMLRCTGTLAKIGLAAAAAAGLLAAFGAGLATLTLLSAAAGWAFG